jgi:hypothetical protein
VLEVLEVLEVLQVTSLEHLEHREHLEHLLSDRFHLAELALVDGAVVAEHVAHEFRPP